MFSYYIDLSLTTMDNILEKQNFLRTQIIEKGYDPKDFVTFLTDKRGEDGADINQWTFLDLKIVFIIIIINISGSQGI